MFIIHSGSFDWLINPKGFRKMYKNGYKGLTVGRKKWKKYRAAKENARGDKMKFIFAKNHFGNELNKTLHFIIYSIYTGKVKF